MSFHDRVFGNLDEAESAMADGYNGGPYQSQFTQGPKASSLFVLPRSGSWPYNSIHVHNNMQGNVRGVGGEQGDPNYGQKNEGDEGEAGLSESLTRLLGLLND